MISINEDWVYKTKPRKTQLTNSLKKVYYLNKNYSNTNFKAGITKNSGMLESQDLKSIDISPVNRIQEADSNISLPAVGFSQFNLMHKNLKMRDFTDVSKEQIGDKIKNISRNNIPSLNHSWDSRSRHRSMDITVHSRKEPEVVSTVLSRSSDDLINHLRNFLDIIEKASLGISSKFLKSFVSYGSLSNTVKEVLTQAESCGDQQKKYPLLSWVRKLCQEIEIIIKQNHKMLQLVETVENKIDNFFVKNNMKAEKNLQIQERVDIIVLAALGKFNREQTRLVNIQAINMDMYAQEACDQLRSKHQEEIQELKKEIELLKEAISKVETENDGCKPRFILDKLKSIVVRDRFEVLYMLASSKLLLNR